MQYKLGKKPAVRSPRLKFSDFTKKPQLPTPPSQFGHEGLISDWLMLGNDRYGDCVFAGAAHETMMWNKIASRDVRFDDNSVLQNYTEVTGFDPRDPTTDQGTDMTLAAKYRRDTGLIDARGQRHKVGAFLALEQGNIQQHAQALWMFGAVGIGILVPSSAMGQFDKNQPWDVERGAQIEGGHYIPLVARRGVLRCVTWARLQPLTDAFFKKYNDESVVYISEEMLYDTDKNGTLESPEGFDLQQLREALMEL